MEGDGRCMGDGAWVTEGDNEDSEAEAVSEDEDDHV
jgi:hypothetical protein